MRHNVYGYKLGRNKDERNRLFKTLLQALFTHGTIETSQQKAKAIKGLVDKVINLSKNKNTQRLLQSYLNNKDLQTRLVKEIVPKLGSRTSGYTSLVRLGTRAGDRTMMVRMSLIGAEKIEPIKKEVPKEEKVPKVSKGKSVAKEIKKSFEKKDRAGRSVRITKSGKRGASRSSKTK